MPAAQSLLERLTPARAGNTSTASTARGTCPAHPRTGGEHGAGRAAGPGEAGSPPHGRGTPWPVGDLSQCDGLTPARAGNTATTTPSGPRRWAHPRTGGEHTSATRRNWLPLGSPPHGRGTLHVVEDHEVGPWLTPARAGNTYPRPSPWTAPRAHPRTGGEHPQVVQGKPHQAGSPPHGRGTPGSLPAALGSWRAHPRTGGEHATNVSGVQTSSVNGQWDLPGGGQQNCPVADSRTARWRTAELPTVQLVSGVTPFPAVAWVRRMLSPAVMTMWAWCSSRSTVALAMVLGMSSSKPAGCRLLDKAMERFS